MTIGTKDFTEEFILGELYKGALEAKGYTVNLKKNIGATEIIDTALTSHKIDAYPEYTGESVATVAKRNEPAKTADEEYQLAKQFYEGRGQTVSDPTPFQDVDAIATTKAYAQKHDLATMEDLKKIGSFSLGARPEFKARQQGLAGMKKVYGINNAKFRQLALGRPVPGAGHRQGRRREHLHHRRAAGQRQVHGAHGPQGRLRLPERGLRHRQEQARPLGGDQFMNVINGVNKLLTTPAITAMNKAVAIDKQDEATVARQFLTANQPDLRLRRGRGPVSRAPPAVDARAASTGATISRSVACGPSASIAVTRKPVASSATRSTSHTVEVSGGASSREIG